LTSITQIFDNKSLCRKMQHCLNNAAIMIKRRKRK
jgi:hypothetical protein